MSDVENRIAGWREQMLTAGVQTPEPLDELENHLREELELQLESGRSPAEAFQVAAQKFGPPVSVRDEFQKVAAALERQKRIQGYLWSAAILGPLQLILVGAVLLNSEMTPGQRISSLTAMAVSFPAVAAGRMARRKLQSAAPRQSGILLFLLITGIISWVWTFALFGLVGHEAPFGRWLATVLWTSCPPLGCFFGLVWRSDVVTSPSARA